MIEVKNLVKKYGSHAAVNDLSFTVETGKVVGFGTPKEAITSETLQSVYDIEMDVITAHDRYGCERTICLPVNNS